MPSSIPLYIFLLTGAVLSIAFKKLTLPAAITGVICGLLVFAGAGYTGVAIMTAFFVIGTLATAHKAAQKQALNAAEADHGRRKASQVLANAGVAALAGSLALFVQDHTSIWGIAVAAAFSAATADTLASELGTIYGRRFYNILTLRPDTRGLDGVVSLEGTLIGLVGSVLITLIYQAGFGFNWVTFISIIVAGTAGNLADSLLGAALERRGLIKNDAVNFLNTLIAAMVGVLICSVF